MNVIDIAIAVLAVLALLRGWHLGLLGQVGSLAGRVGGIVLGVLYAPRCSGLITHAWWRPLLAIGLVWISSVVGSYLGRLVGAKLGEELLPASFKFVNQSLGAVVGVAGVLVVCWLVAGLLSVVTWGSVGNQVSRSVVLRSIQKYLPAPPAFEGRLQSVLNTVNIPNVFALVGGGSVATSNVALGPTKQFQTTPPGVVAVVASGGCRQAYLGTGFYVSPTDVVTDAHIVAGQKVVRVNGLRAVVIAFDTRQDLAVLRMSVPTNVAVPVASQLPAPGTAASVSGFSATATNRSSAPAYFEGTVQAPSRSIYSGGLFLRTVELIAVNVTAGNSGSPVLVNGQVVGVVLAPSSVTKHVAFATSLAALRHDLARLGPTARASTQRCLR